MNFRINLDINMRSADFSWRNKCHWLQLGFNLGESCDKVRWNLCWNFARNLLSPRFRNRGHHRGTVKGHFLQPWWTLWLGMVNNCHPSRTLDTSLSPHLFGGNCGGGFYVLLMFIGKYLKWLMCFFRQQVAVVRAKWLITPGFRGCYSSMNKIPIWSIWWNIDLKCHEIWQHDTAFWQPENICNFGIV